MAGGQLGEHWRRNFPRTLQQKMQVYWHAMHPRDFKVWPIYRAGFSNKEWKAFMLLRDSRSDCINAGHRFTYRDSANDVRYTFDMPKRFKGFPSITVVGEQVLPETRQHLIEWWKTYKEYDDLHSKVHQYAHALLQLDAEKRSINGINTIRQLYAIWPELLPYFDTRWRDVIRGTKVKAKLPAHWDQTYVDLKMNQERMDEINHALTVIPLIPDKLDDRYPTCS